MAQENVKKACTLGVIIDSTTAYFDYKENKYVKKIKIIDESMNNARTTANFRYGYCTVMFFSENIESLPNPFAIGDILYLRRYIFSLVKDSHSKSMMKASKPEITHQIIVHGPCYMVMSKIKILLNINFQKLSSISINKNTAQWKKTLEISDNLPEDFWVNTQFCWPFQPVSTQKIKILLFKSLEKMNKEFLELEMEKDN